MADDIAARAVREAVPIGRVVNQVMAPGEAAAKVTTGGGSDERY